MIDAILELEKQGIRFAPRRLNGIDRFDYCISSPLTKEQTEKLIILKRNEKEVCQYLVDRAKNMLDECRNAIRRENT
jgi:hypothetical protein